MLKNYEMRISYNNENKLYASNKDKTGHYIIDVDASDDALKFVLKPSVKMDNLKFTLTYTYEYADDSVIFPNGYQSWTDSREMGKNDVMPPLTSFAAATKVFSKCNNYGDYDYVTYTKEKGVFHGFSYGYIRNGESLELIGSLNERTGYTIFYYDMPNKKIIVQKELEGIALNQGDVYEIMNIFYTAGGYDEVFDNYFAKLGTPKPKYQSVRGYTSWYNYYANITEQVIERDLESLSKKCPVKIDIFQVDDGYQTATGDWLSIDSTKFPNGMKKAADLIHEKNMLAGLWLAPLNANRKSQIFKDHKDWFIKNAKGTPQFAGANWGGFYTLDIYNEEVRAHLKHVFNTVLREWGYDMVKLDFLYSAAVIPYNGKTRGEIMCDAMDFIKECVGDDKLILGCGVPLFPAFGKVDFCRIGCDVSLNWKRPNYFERYHRENVGTENTLKNSIFRRHLDGRAFVNDPDVFLLRDYNINLTIEQRAIIAKINKLCGNLLFISDNIADYSDEQSKIFLDTITPCEKKVLDAKYVDKDVVYIKYTEDGVEKEFTFNIKDGVLISGTL